jgi:hypothetical protein
MNLKELFNGVAVVIDDEYRNSDANITAIVRQIKQENIPVLGYSKLPNIDSINHFHNISFLLLDWELKPESIQDIDINDEIAISIPSELSRAQEKDSIDFLKQVFSVTFCPIFIFSNLDIESIRRELVENLLFFTDKPNRIFIQRKSDLTTRGELFNAVEKWLVETPSMYVLKQWQYEYGKALGSFFNDFQVYSPYWPLVMWKNFKEDINLQDSATQINHQSLSLELADILSKNIFTRMSPFNFNKEILGKEHKQPNSQELRKIIEGGMFLKNLDSNDIGTGDLFKGIDENGNVIYYLNVRAQCDLLRSDNIILYCLVGRALQQNGNGKIKDIHFSQGEYIEKKHHAIIAFVDNGKILEFQFMNLELKSFDEIKEKRIGRLLPPYITKIQQRFALYLQRQGLPRIPSEAIKTPRPDGPDTVVNPTVEGPNE